MASPLHCEYILAILKDYSTIVHHLERALECALETNRSLLVQHRQDVMMMQAIVPALNICLPCSANNFLTICRQVGDHKAWRTQIVPEAQ